VRDEEEVMVGGMGHSTVHTSTSRHILLPAFLKTVSSYITVIRAMSRNMGKNEQEDKGKLY
jgi:hypothetical protein